MRLKRLISTALFVVITLGTALPASANKSAYLSLAKKGWNYQLRVAVRKDKTIPVHINGRDFTGSTICIVGEPPHSNTRTVLSAFLALLQRSFGHPTSLQFVGQSAQDCGQGQIIVLRLYSGFPPNRAFSSDLQWMNQNYDIGLPEGREYSVTSPAQAQTYFGRRGKGTHIMVKQPALAQLGPLEQAFYTSILLEELYQSFTFGMDVLHFDSRTPFISKLQETPLNLTRLPWNSRQFMRALVRSNPMRLCAFDVFMLHAVAQAPVDQTTEPQFIDFIDKNYEALFAQSAATIADPQFAEILDQNCAPRD